MRSALEGENTVWVVNSLLPSYVHYEFDSEASDEGAKDADAPVTIINPVLALMNAIQMQLKMSLDFSNLNLPFTCEQMKMGIFQSGPSICGLIPAVELNVTCSSLPGILVGVCTGADAVDGDINGETLMAFIRDWDATNTTKYEYLSVPAIDLKWPCFYPDVDQVSLIQVLYNLINCEDPLRLWPVFEKIFLEPLGKKIDCNVPDLSLIHI